MSVVTAPIRSVDFPMTWGSINPPLQSYFPGFGPPTDARRWSEALTQASRGEQILLSKVLEAIRSPFDLHEADIEFKWIHKVAEYHMSKGTSNWRNDIWFYPRVHQDKAPIVMMGFHKFDRSDHEGRSIVKEFLTPFDVTEGSEFSFPRKIVAVGRMDENWGWASSYFLNRTAPLWINFGNDSNPYSPSFKYPDELLKNFVTDPNVVMLVVNQHHNLSHPKVISIPLGVGDAKEIFKAMKRAEKSGQRKDTLLFSAGSNYGYRPAIRECVAKNLGPSFNVSERMYRVDFYAHLASAYVVLAMPGIGYDTYRLWEALAVGDMPVVERGMGMDRTFYKLPVLMLDDYSEINETIIRQAYVEALYRADEWEYDRLTRRWWQRLLFEVSEAGSAEVLQRLHPMAPEEGSFTRPLVPFDCAGVGGCGAGTRRVPAKSCAIDPAVMSASYEWDWKHHNPPKTHRH